MLLRPSQRGPLGQSLVARRPLDVGRNAEGPWRLEGFELANQGWNGRAKIEELSRRRMFQNFQWTFVYHILMKVPEVLVKFEKGEVERGSRSYYKGRELKRGHGFCLWSRFDVTKSVAWASAPAPAPAPALGSFAFAIIKSPRIKPFFDNHATTSPTSQRLQYQSHLEEHPRHSGNKISPASSQSTASHTKWVQT
jgi:hypothetical protein